MKIDAIRHLRERTGAGIAACRDALVASGGDMERAVDALRAKGWTVRPGRVSAEGLVFAWVDDDRQRGAIVEINCETDFASNSLVFKSFGEDVACIAAFEGVSDADQLTAMVQPTLEGVAARLRENVVIRRCVCYQVGS
jgi:elongation factor Ts